MDDDELMAAVAAGDYAALRELFMPARAVAGRMLGAALLPPDVEVLMQ
jgi:hypothetical protein